jgi:hypothetical protein
MTTTADHHAPNDMISPDFSSIAPSQPQIDRWARHPSLETALVHAYRAGAQYAAEQLAGRWPEPITDRTPTKSDADENGLIEIFTTSGYWDTCTQRTAAVTGTPWRHSPQWKPPAHPPHPADTLAAIIREVDGNHTMGAAQLAEALLAHPDIRRTLEVKS